MKKDTARKTVAVLFGGPSFEHEISVLTGVFALNVLKRSEYDLLPVYIGTDGNFYTSPAMFDVESFTDETKKSFIKIIFVRNEVYRYGKRLKFIKRVDCAFNCCHGGWGEGGGVSALMQIYEVPLVAPDAALSALFMDKVLSKPLIAGMGIPYARYSVLCEEAFLSNETGEIDRIVQEAGLPAIVKPARLGSSIGVTVAHTEKELRAAVQVGFSFDKELLIEEYFPDKRDVNCAAYAANGKIFVSECEEPLSAEQILSFREKYLAGGKQRRCKFPAEVPAVVAEEVKSITERLYRELHFTGMVRADFLLSGDKVYFNEMNTVPGSLAYYLFTDKITGAKKLFCTLIEEAMAAAEKRIKPIPTGILNEVKKFSGVKSGRK